MNKKLKNIQLELRFFFGNRQNIAMVFALVLLVALVAFGLFGIPAIYKVTQEQKQTVMDLENINMALAKKDSILNALVSEQDKLDAYQQKLSTVLPQEQNLQVFLTDLVSTLAERGYRLLSFTHSSAGTTTLSVALRMEGPTAELPSVISSVESMPRLVYIRELSVVNEKANSHLDMTVNVFFDPLTERIAAPETN